MKNSFLFLALLVSAGAVANAATPSRVSEFTTLTGRTYRQCRISQVHPDGVSFFHSKGAAKVLYADMSDDWKKKLGHSVEREQEHQKQASMKKFLQQENEAKARQQWAANQQEQAERQLRILERAALLRERQGLIYQQQLAALYGAQVPAFGPAPAVGWPGTYFGPLNAVHGPSFGGRPWCDRGSISLASIGGGSGGYLSIRSNNCVWIGGGHAWRNPAVWQSPTLGSYIPGKFAPFGSAGPFGGVYLGGARALGQVGLGSVAWQCRLGVRAACTRRRCRPKLPRQCVHSRCQITPHRRSRLKDAVAVLSSVLTDQARVSVICRDDKAPAPAPPHLLQPHDSRFCPCSRRCERRRGPCR